MRLIRCKITTNYLDKKMPAPGLAVTWEKIIRFISFAYFCGINQ